MGEANAGCPVKPDNVAIVVGGSIDVTAGTPVSVTAM
jgi:hypothetical protein